MYQRLLTMLNPRSLVPRLNHTGPAYNFRMNGWLCAPANAVLTYAHQKDDISARSVHRLSHLP